MDEPPEPAAGPEPAALGLEPQERPPVRRNRGILYAGITVLVLFVGGLVIALLGTRENRDAVPGPQPVASLAAISSGFLVGTIGALYASPDAMNWTPARLPAELVATTSANGIAYVLAGGDLRSTVDLHTFKLLATGVSGTVIAASPDGSVDVVKGPGAGILRVAPDGTVTQLPIGPTAPTGLLGLAVSPVTATTVLAGSPVTGLWETRDDGATWFRVVPTPTQAVMIDQADPQRFFLGSPGGLLVSANGGTLWRFSDLRIGVHALSQANGAYYAVGDDRVIYRSVDGMKGWAPDGG